ncbi:hypothetical protein SGLAM104S_00652 [Streptomyces glaucescens]
MICFSVPQPCDGRCWKRPSESRSPWSMLRSADSCSAVASAIVTARSGSPRAVPTAVIVAAFTACSGENSYVAPSPSPETTLQPGPPAPPVTYCTARYPATASRTTKAAPQRRRRP